MPAASVSKEFGIGGSHIIGGDKGGPRKDANAYEAFQATFSDLINIRSTLSGLIAADGGTTTGVTVPTGLLTVVS